MTFYIHGGKKKTILLLPGAIHGINFKSLPSEIEAEKDKLVLWVVNTLFLYKIGICWQ